eukprot:scaffold1300_cov317-Prasinococcus_capsulatus_cf.AAC.7
MIGRLLVQPLSDAIVRVCDAVNVASEELPGHPAHGRGGGENRHGDRAAPAPAAAVETLKYAGPCHPRVPFSSRPRRPRERQGACGRARPGPHACAGSDTPSQA